MPVVKCAVNTTGMYVTAQSWILLADGTRVDFKSGQAQIPAGHYELKWFFIADPGASVTYVVDAKDSSTNKAPCKAGPFTVPNGSDRISSGKYKPLGYIAVEFDVQ